MAAGRLLTSLISRNLQLISHQQWQPLTSAAGWLSQMRMKAGTLLCADHCIRRKSHVLEGVSSQVRDAKETSLEAMSPTEILANLDAERLRKLKIIQMEYDVLQQTGSRLPEDVSDAMWLKLMDCTTLSARKKLYRYFRKTEVATLSKKKKKEARRRLLEEQKKNCSDEPKVCRNTFFMYVRQKTMNIFYYSRIAYSMMFGPQVVIDLDYEHAMRQQDVVRLIEQLLSGYGENKLRSEPFHLVLCNAAPGGSIVRAFQNSCGYSLLDDYMFTITAQSYLDLYPRNKLVYLTPNAPNELTEFDDDAVYIIGGLVDKNKPEPLALARAKEQNLKMAKFPLDRYLKWSSGNKSLCVDQVIKILLDLRETGDWQKAFCHVPIRKLVREGKSPVDTWYQKQHSRDGSFRLGQRVMQDK